MTHDTDALREEWRKLAIIIDAPGFSGDPRETVFDFWIMELEAQSARHREELENAIHTTTRNMEEKHVEQLIRFASLVDRGGMMKPVNEVVSIIESKCEMKHKEDLESIATEITSQMYDDNSDYQPIGPASRSYVDSFNLGISTAWAVVRARIGK